MSEPKHHDILGKKWGVRRFKTNSDDFREKATNDKERKRSNAIFHAIHGMNLTKPVREILEKYDK